METPLRVAADDASPVVPVTPQAAATPQTTPKTAATSVSGDGDAQKTPAWSSYASSPAKSVAAPSDVIVVSPAPHVSFRDDDDFSDEGDDEGLLATDEKNPHAADASSPAAKLTDHPYFGCSTARASERSKALLASPCAGPACAGCDSLSDALTASLPSLPSWLCAPRAEPLVT
eukprot:CAMPEP_0185697864 /NCGR_PEP_ID=MMETSP1164-20130828/6002_1 /TAXON_ID=1104430 /ORGANISM="Chrysoreinhardia sp, Strain CCMP2950" /LENGTH=173 /DNA_ID=CAMNT_0028364763 /DNA_START=24 /DNA_END=545 /DNA_ORIENTATION=-